MGSQQNFSNSEIPSLPPGVKTHTLENGLVIIVREDHSAPVVSAQAWCKTGSIDEAHWLGAGLSHMLEHMLFKGTKTRGTGRIDQEVQEAGGYMNAYTSFDRTVYWINVPNTGARIAIDILCDVMQNATLPSDELEKEKQVILREMDMNQDDPGQRASRRLFEVAYTRSPYRFTIIGYPDIFNQVSPDDLTSYYRQRYAPNNTFFVVTGDINANEVIDQVKKAYAGAKEKPLPPIVLPEEPKQIAPRVVIEEAPIELGHFHFSWHTPSIRHPDAPVLDVLATLLGSGRSSRLFQEVRQKKGLVTYVDAWTYTPGDAGMFGMSAVADAEKFTAATEAMLAEIERMKNEKISDAELSKAVKQFTAGHLSTRKTMQGQAQDLGGSWMSANDLNFSERYLATVKRITPEDLQRVAREYLTAENRTLYALLPEGAAPKETSQTETISEHPIQKFEFANGLRLLIKEDHRLPFVEFRAVFRGGVLAETVENSGITQLMSKMLLQGTTSRTAEQIAEEIESVGGHIDTFGGNNSFGVNTEILSDDFETGLSIFSDVILNPTFPTEHFEREREIQFENIRARKDDLLRSAAQMMRRALFGDSGYGLESLGTEESVKLLSVGALKTFHERLAAPNNCVIAIYGDVKTDAVRATIEKYFGDWKRSANLDDLINRKSSPVNSSRRAVENVDKKQAVLVIGFPATTLFDADRYALELIQESCSDLGSRLFMRVRENLGLAYYVGAQHFPGLVPGYFAFYAGTEPEKATLVESEMLKEADLLCADGLSTEELKRAKAKVIGQKKIARQELGGFASLTALDELYGLGFANSDSEDAKYEAVTLEQVRAVAHKYLRREAVAIALVEPKKS
jgi:zinc protease